MADVDDISNQFLEEQDWEQEFKKAKSLYDLRKIYNNFCISVFGKDGHLDQAAAKVLDDISIAVETELKAKGYTFMQNPFLDFIKDMVVRNPKFFTKEKYNLIHNSYIDNLINDDDLRGKGAFKKGNLIFSPELYRFDTATMRDYLKVQSWIKDLSSSDIYNAKVNKKYDDFEKESDKRQFAIDLLHSGLPAKEFASESHSDPNSKLRSLFEIKQLITWMGGLTDKKQEKTNFTDIYDDIDSPETGKKIISAILYGAAKNAKQDTTKKTVKDLARFYKDYLIILPEDEIKSLWAKIMRRYNITYSIINDAVNLVSKRVDELEKQQGK